MTKRNKILVFTTLSLMAIIFPIMKISYVPYQEKAIVIKKEIYSERIDVKFDSLYTNNKLIYSGIEELTEEQCYITSRSVKNRKVYRTSVDEKTFKHLNLKDTCTVTFNYKVLKWGK